MIDFGINQDDFFCNFFEKKFGLFKKVIKTPIYNWYDLNNDIFSIDHHQPFLKMIKNGVRVDEDEYINIYHEVGLQRAFLNQKKVNDILKDGGTLILNRMHYRSSKINEIAMSISKFVCETTISNGYLAFGEKESFGAHWDTHDVFVVQLLGRKRWQIFEPTFESPLSTQTSKDHKHELIDKKPIFDQIIEEGDILYIPRGWWHTAIPLNEETFHIAVGVHPIRNKDYIEWLINNKASEFLSYRKSFKLEAEGEIESLANFLACEIKKPENLLLFNKKIDENKLMFNSFSIEKFCLENNEELLKSRIRINTMSRDLKKIFHNGIELDLDEKTMTFLMRLNQADTFQDAISDLQHNEVIKTKKLVTMLAEMGFLSMERM